ncbi:ubiquitin C-terminal hydrolase [Purpureocillium lavendulum]|uniref:Ubiquitin C-terminal hydrolase n=1 Tax=Purpureocillium lavendulum TaxID=1247861 RepID=A0AB34G1Y6_9HYPO|nr:ubiquitin C-terminal hydrolase [Purpureocillium lavendulum]
MAPSSPSSTTAPELPEEESSPELSSTRPNPFDDGDGSSRKRRRTSASGSPTASLDTVNPVHDDSSSTTLEGDQSRSGSTMAVDEKPAVPIDHAPPQLDATRQDARTSDAAAADSPAAASGTAPASGFAASSPVEAPPATEANQDGSVSDDEMSLSAPLAEGHVPDDNPLLVDPMTQFPYNQPEESVYDTLQRLIDYLSSDQPIDGVILRAVVDWMDNYIRFSRQASPAVVLESRRIHKDFWHAFPQVIGSLLPRRWELLKIPVLRNRLLDYYVTFARLTVRLLTLDSMALRDIDTSDNASAPTVLAPAHLHQLQNTMAPQGYEVNPLYEDAAESGWTPANLALHLVRTMRDSPESVSGLAALAEGLSGSLARWPKLADNFAPLSRLIIDYLREALRDIDDDQEDQERADRFLDVCHNISEAMTTSLMAVIDKHVGSLNPECAALAIRSLAEAFELWLRSGNQQARDRVNQHGAQYPAVAHRFSPEAIAWEWKVDALEKLVRSGQMNIRMAGVTTLCSHLVSIWKRFNVVPEENSAALLEHLSRHMLQTGLVDFVLGGSCHPEIIFECSNIIGFLVVTKTYRTEHSDQIWNGLTSSQDPRMVDALTRMLTAVSTLFDGSELLHICKKFQLLPLEKYSPSIRVVLDNILSEMMARCTSTLTSHPYVLCLRLLREASAATQDSQIADQDVQRLAMQKFKELLGYGPDAEGRVQLYQSCINDIASQSTTTLGSLWCLSMAIRNTAGTQMHVLTEDHDLARLIVEELEHAGQAGRPGTGCPVLSGTVNHPRREFVTNIIQLEPAAIDNELGARLWDLLVGSQSTCSDDRRAGWHIILGVARRTSFHNTFLETSFVSFLPKLPDAYLCDGVLDFVKEKIQCLSKDSDAGAMLNDEAPVVQIAIEQLWRLILWANDSALVDQAIATLALGVYLEDGSIAGPPLHRIRRMHLALVGRCLNQMKDAADTLKRSVDGKADAGDDPMIIVLSEAESQRQERIFTRSLQLLRYFLKKYQSKPNFAVADLRSFMSQTPEQIAGDSAQLKFQSFDGDEQTDIKPLNIGKLNTISSLLASIREETGFDNYRAYYRGRQLLPAEEDICKSLQELDIQDGFIIVKREESYSSSPVRIKPGSLLLEVEVLAHFQDLWDYLSMEERIAEEIYDFVVNIPADGYIMSQFDGDSASSYKKLFLPGQPFKSLYAIHALTEYIESARRATLMVAPGTTNDCSGTPSAHDEALRRSLRIVVQALSDPVVLEGTTMRLKMRLASALMQTFAKLVQGVGRSRALDTNANPIDMPAPKRLVELLSNAVKCEDDADVSFWAEVAKVGELRELLQALVLYDCRRGVRIAVVDLLESYMDLDAPMGETPVDISPSERPTTQRLARYLWPVISDLVCDAVELPDQCQELFRLLNRLLVRLRGQVDLESLAFQTGKLLLEYETTEDLARQDRSDPVIACLATVLLLCLNEDTSLATSGSWPKDFIPSLLSRHLFPGHAEEGALSVSRVVLNTDTRAKLCDVILRLASPNHQELQGIQEMLYRLVPFYDDDTDDPYFYDLPQQFERSTVIRSPCGYAGLRNLSNTCYLNSLLSQLYMNPAFRQFILGINVDDRRESQELLFHTQNVFGHMQESYRRFVDPTAFVSAIKYSDNTTIDITRQMDVDEFYSLLFERWESQLPLLEDRKTFKSFYGGQLVQQVKSKECEHISERVDSFSAIQCDIKGKSSLEASLQAYVEGEVMDGDNKYKCSTCDRHVDAIKRACLKDIPDNVIFHLKRFDFSLRTLSRSKINDRFSFPRKIDMRPYTIEYLTDPDTAASTDVFELVGVLVHAGTAESGHYYSYTKERPSSQGEDSWVEFNDETVTRWDPALMASATFGGPDNRALYEGDATLYDKPYSAYMLFYQRSSSLEMQQGAMGMQQLTSPLHVPIPAPLQEHIVQENTVILRRHCLFDASHSMFVQACFNRSKELDRESTMLANQGHELQGLAMEVMLSHLDQIVSRTKDTPFFASHSKDLQNSTSDCPNCAQDFVKYFLLRPAAYRALLQRNPEQHVRAFAGESMIHAVKRLAEVWPRAYGREGHSPSSSGSCGTSREGSIALDSEITGLSILKGMMVLFNHLWRYFHLHLRSWEEVFGTMLSFARLGARETGALLSEDFLARLLRIVAADDSSDLAPNYARMLTTVRRRGNARAPSYFAIIALIDHLMAHLQPALGIASIVDAVSERIDHDLPAPWTAGEVRLVYDEPADGVGSLFVEKLVSIDQAWGHTKSILGRLSTMGTLMELKMLETLRRNIQIESANVHIDVFLKAAGPYVESTPVTKHAELLIRQVCDQAGKLQNYEGAAFLEFIKLAMRSRQPDEEAAKSRKLYCLDLMPSWAPPLLVYHDADTRRDAEELIDEELVGPWAEGVSNDKDDEKGDEDGATRSATLDRLVQRLAAQCLIHLRDVHVKRGAEIGRQAAYCILTMVEKCISQQEQTQDSTLDDDVALVALRSEITEPLKSLIMEDMEDDGSEWEGSCASSEPNEANVGITMEAGSQFNE